MRFLVNHVRLVFAILFVVVCTGLFAWERVYIWPQHDCEARPAHVWAPGFHACAEVVHLPHLRRARVAPPA